MKIPKLKWLLPVLVIAGCQTPADSRTCDPQPKPKHALPELHVTRSASFKAPYGCRGSYEDSALFLSEYSKNRNTPDLLYNGACRSEKYFDVNTAGDDMALIADLGAVPLDTISAYEALRRDRAAPFMRSAPIVVGHTYAVTISKDDLRGMIVFQVENIVADGELRIRYAVKSYAIQKEISRSEGFDWSTLNSESPTSQGARLHAPLSNELRHRD